MERRFPVLGLLKGDSCPSSISWERIAPHEDWALRNHDQSLERLAERGGLDPVEIWCVVTGRSFWAPGRLSRADAIVWLSLFGAP